MLKRGRTPPRESPYCYIKPSFPQVPRQKHPLFFGSAHGEKWYKYKDRFPVPHAGGVVGGMGQIARCSPEKYKFILRALTNAPTDFFLDRRTVPKK
jgi:hypothetical protein